MTKCMFCEEKFTGVELKELKEIGEKYARTKHGFICPDCYDNFGRLSLEEQLLALFRGKEYQWPREIVEVCPHCMHENAYTISDEEVKMLHGKVICGGCGEKILLCGECTRGHCELQPNCFEFSEDQE